MKKVLLILTACFQILTVCAEGNVDQSAADFLRRSDSMYVVISILVTIFAGIIVFLIFQERKISKLEKQLKINSNEQKTQ